MKARYFFVMILCSNVWGMEEREKRRPLPLEIPKSDPVFRGEVSPDAPVLRCEKTIFGPLEQDTIARVLALRMDKQPNGKRLMSIFTPGAYSLDAAVRAEEQGLGKK